MLSLPDFEPLFRSRGAVQGSLILVFLATFNPIGQRFGIPGVQRASAHLAGIVAQLAPAGSIVGSLSSLTTGVFVPDDAQTSSGDFVASLHSTVTDQDLELEPGDWAEIRAAIGVVEITGREPDSHALLKEAARRAESDQNRFPKEWEYPVVVFDN